MQRLIAEAEARATDYPIDYEHQILEAKQNGQPAPAAGWFRRLEAREDGLWAVDVQWTERARQMIAAGEYRYISPVFAYDRKTGRVTRLLMAAITNNPALDGLTDLAPLTDTMENCTMIESLAALAAHLNIADGEDAAAAALAALKAKDDEIAALKREVEAVQAAAVPMSEHAKLQAELAALRADMEAAERERLLEAGLSDGRILPAQRDYWAAQPLAALKAWLDERTADDLIDIATAVLEVNLDFFVQRVVPRIEALASKLTQTASGGTSGSSASPAPASATTP